MEKWGRRKTGKDGQRPRGVRTPRRFRLRDTAEERQKKKFKEEMKEELRQRQRNREPLSVTERAAAKAESEKTEGLGFRV